MADPATETTDPGNGKIFSSRNLVENIVQKSWQSETKSRLQIARVQVHNK